MITSSERITGSIVLGITLLLVLISIKQFLNSKKINAHKLIQLHLANSILLFIILIQCIVIVAGSPSGALFIGSFANFMTFVPILILSIAVIDTNCALLQLQSSKKLKIFIITIFLVLQTISFIGRSLFQYENPREDWHLQLAQAGMDLSIISLMLHFEYEIIKMALANKRLIETHKIDKTVTLLKAIYKKLAYVVVISCVSGVAFFAFMISSFWFNPLPVDERWDIYASPSNIILGEMIRLVPCFIVLSYGYIKQSRVAAISTTNGQSQPRIMRLNSEQPKSSTTTTATV